MIAGLKLLIYLICITQLNSDFRDKIAGVDDWVAIQAKSGNTSRRLQLNATTGQADIFTSTNDWDSYKTVKLLTNADLARGFQSAVQVPANSYADREVSHGLDGTPVSAVATLKVNTTNSENMANVQIQINEITSSAIKVRIHNNTNNAATVNFYWAAFL